LGGRNVVFQTRGQKKANTGLEPDKKGKKVVTPTKSRTK